MTHIQNMPHIIANGITGKRSPNANKDYVPIGDVSLINTRASYYFPIGGTSLLLGDFIPFYFWVKMPMLYVIQHGFNSVKRTSAQDIVYLVCDTNDIVQAGYTFYFSDGHATDSFTSFYTSSQVGMLQQILKWDAIKSKYWNGDTNLDLKRQKQAEFLVLDDIASVYIKWFICYNDVASKRLASMGIDNKNVKICPGAYY